MMQECPNCQAPFPPDMMLDIRQVPETVRITCQWLEASGTLHDRVCSSCMESANILSRATHADLALATVQAI